MLGRHVVNNKNYGYNVITWLFSEELKVGVVPLLQVSQILLIQSRNHWLCPGSQNRWSIPSLISQSQESPPQPWNLLYHVLFPCLSKVLWRLDWNRKLLTEPSPKKLQLFTFCIKLKMVLVSRSKSELIWIFPWKWEGEGYETQIKYWTELKRQNNTAVS